MSYIGEHNPKWLAKAVFNDTLDWTKSIRTTFPTFLEHVTLHDSYWKGLLLTALNETIIVIKLDVFWNMEYALRTENSNYWPFLIIRINKTVNIFCNPVEGDMTISTADSRNIATAELEKLIDDFSESVLLPKGYLNWVFDCKQLHKTRFFYHSEVAIEILHDAEIDVLLLEEDGQYIDPGLEKAKSLENRPKEKRERWIQQIWKKIREN